MKLKKRKVKKGKIQVKVKVGNTVEIVNKDSFILGKVGKIVEIGKNGILYFTPNKSKEIYVVFESQIKLIGWAWKDNKYLYKKEESKKMNVLLLITGLLLMHWIGDFLQQANY